MKSDFTFTSLPSFEEIEKKAWKNASSGPALNPEKFMVDDALIDHDYTYLKELFPDSIKGIFESMEDACDRLEYEGSFLFDEAPDKTTLLKLVQSLSERLSDDFTVEKKDLIQALLCDEILFRRMRYYKRKKMFQ